MSNPYPGARPLTAVHERLLIGREDAVTSFARLARQYSVVAVLGPSGVGKSSLIGAGFVGRLNNDSDLIVRTFSSWSKVPDLPGMAWYASALQQALLGGNDAKQVRVLAVLGDLPRPAAKPMEFIAGVQQYLGDDLVVIFDQLEELLRSGDPLLGHKFLTNIRGVAQVHPKGYTQVASLRQEYGTHLKIIQQSLENSLWEEVYVDEVRPEFVPAFVTEPLTVAGEGVTATAALAEMISESWKMARPPRLGDVKTSIVDENQTGLLHLQAFLYVMYDQLKPTAGAELTAEAVSAVMGPWPRTAEDARELFDSALRLYVKGEFARRAQEFVDKAPPAHEESFRQLARESIRIASALPEHLTSAGFKLLRGTDELAATVLSQLRDLHYQPPGGFTSSVPPGMGQGNDVGQRVRPLALELATRCREKYAEDAAGLETEVLAAFPGLAEWGDPEIPSGRLRGESALRTACELVVDYERAINWLADGAIIRMTTSRSHGRETRIASLVHDGLGGALLSWSESVLDDPAMAVSLPSALAGKQVFYRPDVDQEDLALTPEVIAVTEGLGWIGCNVRALFKNITFRNCDFRSTLFDRCRFLNVVLEDCLTHGLLFLDCRFEGAFTVRSSGHNEASGRSKELKTLTFARGCRVTDGLLTIENLGGYGVFLDDFSGPWTVNNCSFTHMVVQGPTGVGSENVPGAGPGTIINSKGVSHIAVRGRVSGGIQIIGSDEPEYLEAPGVSITYPGRVSQSAPMTQST